VPKVLGRYDWIGVTTTNTLLHCQRHGGGILKLAGIEQAGAPWRAMPVVVITSSAILPLPGGNRGDNGAGTHWFHWVDGRTPNGPIRAKNALNPSGLAGFQAGFP